MKKNNVTVSVKDATKRNKRFESLCVLSQSDLKKKLYDELVAIGGKDEVICDDGYLYMEGNLPIMVIAHLDTVHKELPKEIVYVAGMISSPQGIGGDDRCGVYIAMKLAKEENRPHILFCEDEEVGGKGSLKFTRSDVCRNLFGKINYCIDIDRKGNDDAVYYDQDNGDFEKFIEKSYWKTAYGSFTDICTICPELEVAGVNLSCGYYKQHTTDEFVVLSEMEKCYEEIKALIERTTSEDKFEYIEYEYVSYWGKYGDSLGGYNRQIKEPQTETYYILYLTTDGEEVYFVEATSEAEAIGWFCMDFPNFCYNDIIEYGYADDLDSDRYFRSWTENK